MRATAQWVGGRGWVTSHSPWPWATASAPSAAKYGVDYTARNQAVNSVTACTAVSVRGFSAEPSLHRSNSNPKSANAVTGPASYPSSADCRVAPVTLPFAPAGKRTCQGPGGTNAIKYGYRARARRGDCGLGHGGQRGNPC